MVWIFSYFCCLNIMNVGWHRDRKCNVFITSRQGGSRERGAGSTPTKHMCRKNTYSNREFDIVDPNKLVIWYLFLVGPLIYIRYWILYVRYATLYATHSILTFKYRIKTFLENQPSNQGYYSCQKHSFFRARHFSLMFAKPLYQNVRIDPRIVFAVW